MQYQSSHTVVYAGQSPHLWRGDLVLQKDAKNTMGRTGEQRSSKDNGKKKDTYT